MGGGEAEGVQKPKILRTSYVDGPPDLVATSELGSISLAGSSDFCGGDTSVPLPSLQEVPTESGGEEIQECEWQERCVIQDP